MRLDRFTTFIIRLCAFVISVFDTMQMLGHFFTRTFSIASETGMLFALALMIAYAPMYWAAIDPQQTREKQQ